MSADRHAVDLAYHCLLFLVDGDDPRELAEERLNASTKLRAGMSAEVREAVLDRFEPTRDPKPGLDYLPVTPVMHRDVPGYEWGELR